MCGIVGFIGVRPAKNILLDGLAKLEYRGYDSAGIAVLENELTVEKSVGKLANLVDKLKDKELKASIGIGHTRWATHGKPSDANAHPHTSANKKFAIVHNGIIENYLQLKEEYLKDVRFQSETDTEVVAQLLGKFYNGNLEETVRRVLALLKGSYTLVILCSDYPDLLIACRKANPLVLGVGEGENFIASDVPALLAYTRNCIYPNDGELCFVKREGIIIKDSEGKVIEPKIKQILWNAEAVEKNGYEHYMLKEIHEQPDAFRRMLKNRLKDGKVYFEEFTWNKEQAKKWRKIHIVACGTAYHSGLVGRTVFEKLAKIPVEVEIASEFRYREPMLDEDTLVIAISQSGETADTKAALEEGKSKGCKVLALTNVVDSAVAREADYVFYLQAGPEISVASTKAYTTMLLAQYLLAIYLADLRECISQDAYASLVHQLTLLPQYAEKIMLEENLKQLAKLAEEYHDTENLFFVGRGMDWAIALEGSLKLKEISYIHAEAYAAGELKHGTLALITDKTPVIALAVQEKTYDKTLSNIKEIKARDAKVLAVVKEGAEQIDKVVDKVLYLPAMDDMVMPILSVIPLQLIAYYRAKNRGCSIDQPRNLAKSVTVE